MDFGSNQGYSDQIRVILKSGFFLTSKITLIRSVFDQIKVFLILENNPNLIIGFWIAGLFSKNRVIFEQIRVIFNKKNLDFGSNQGYSPKCQKNNNPNLIQNP